MELVLSACSTYDKKTSLPGRQKRAVYATKHYNGYDTLFVDETSGSEY
jgi:hypothetical protein